MKILKLRFKNLNSLVGEWEIDFSHPRYSSDGIFAISGPTGSGKSTLLDAICLALYGRTPRLGVISKTTNEIMSRQTGECFAEVIFETQKGQFLCTWSQHRARKKADGKLAEPNHEIAIAGSGQIVESKRSKTAEAIEERTGMNFERFTQSMLLAQGGFAAFLQAAPNERAPILEQITGTEIYSAISMDVFNRQRAEKAKLDVLKAETEGITLLSQEAEDQLIHDLPAKQAAEKETATKKAGLDHAVSWIENIEKIKKELDGIAQEKEKHTLTIEEFASGREQLDKANRAFELEGDYATLLGIRKSQHDELEILLQSESQVPELEREIESASRHLKEAREKLTFVQEASKVEREQIKKTRVLDVNISGKQTFLQTALKEHNNTLSQQSQAISTKKGLQNQASGAREELGWVEKYLTGNAKDALLVAELTGIKELLKTLEESKSKNIEISRQITASKKLLESETEQFKKLETVCQDLKIRKINAENKVNESKIALGNLLGERQIREYRAEVDNLKTEMAYLRIIAGMEAERAQLEDNKPCPLCGSLHHPFAEGNIPSTGDIDKKISVVTGLIDQAEKLEVEQRNQEIKVQQALNELTEAEKKLVQAHHQKDQCQSIIEVLMKDEKVTSEKNSSLSAAVIHRLLPLGITEIPDTGPEALTAMLDHRLKNWQYHQQKKTDIDKRIGDLESEIKSLDAIIISRGDSIKLKSEEIEVYRKELHNLQDQRTELYGLKNTDEGERRLEALVTAAAESERVASKIQNQWKQKLEGLSARIRELKDSTSKRKGNLDQEEEKLKISFRKAGFDNEDIFKSSRLSKEQRDRLTRHAEELDLKKADIESRKKDRERKLAEERSKIITVVPLDELIKEVEAISQVLKSMGEEIGAIKQQLNTNAEAKDQFSKKMQEVDAQISECKRWDALQYLIGSADGKKYRNFAQGLTFELMVSHANRQLSRLTDRYLLIRDEEQPLNLNVIDNYQAGEIRSTRNLSGGESFIVSLALALGLSHMASRKVRVDSLFLDEGFGSLDEDTLETALDTLASLRQDGKLIGVISHVSALKERISTQILVQPLSGGKSKVVGPGCSQNN